MPSVASLSVHLTTCLRQVLGLVAEGKTDPRLPLRSYTAKKTVDRHLEKIFARLGVSSQATATVVAGAPVLLERWGEKWGVCPKPSSDSPPSLRTHHPEDQNNARSGWPRWP